MKNKHSLLTFHIWLVWSFVLRTTVVEFTDDPYLIGMVNHVLENNKGTQFSEVSLSE